MVWIFSVNAYFLSGVFYVFGVFEAFLKAFMFSLQQSADIPVGMDFALDQTCARAQMVR